MITSFFNQLLKNIQELLFLVILWVVVDVNKL
jgi:hypothetical protein